MSTQNRASTPKPQVLTLPTSDVTETTRFASYLFPPVVLWSGIPVFAIIIRYNLVQEKVCGVGMANLIAVVLPWAAALVLYAGTLLNTLLNWSGLLLVVPLNFLLPCWLYLESRANEKPLRAVSDARDAFNSRDQADPLNAPSSTSALAPALAALGQDDDEASLEPERRGKSLRPHTNADSEGGANALGESLLRAEDSGATKSTSMPVFWPADGSIQSTVKPNHDTYYMGISMQRHGVLMCKVTIVVSVILNLVAIAYAI